MAFRLTRIFAVLWLLAGCSPSSDQQRLSITGSSTIAPVVAELARLYEAQHSNVRIDVQTGGSSRGIADAKAGLADIGMVSRELKPADGVQSHALALDGLAIVVHAKNPVESLTSDQIKALYTGRLSSWSEVGVIADKPVTVVHKASGRSTQEVFLKHFALDESAIKPSVVIGDNEQGIKTVAGNPWAIGYVSIGAAQYSAANNVPIKLLPLDGVQASIKTVKNKRYALSRQLNLVTASKPAGLAAEFIRFAQSEQAASVIQGLYFVPLVGQ